MKKLGLAILVIVVLVAAGAAYYLHSNPSYTLRGQVIDADNKQVVSGATVTINGKTTKADVNGSFTLALGRSKAGSVAITADNYDPASANLSSATVKSTGLFTSTLSEKIEATPTVQTEAARKWDYIKYGQYSNVWALINPDEDSLVPESKYTNSLSSSMAAISSEGGQIGDQTVASVVTLPTWTEPSTGKTYANVKELQTTQNYTILGQTVNKNFVVHWVLANGVWTFFVNSKDPSYDAE